MLGVHTCGMTTEIRLTLTADGEDIEGDGIAPGESGFIDCLAYTDGVATDQAPAGRSLGRRHYEPVVIRKRIDRSSPRLLQALTENREVRATLRFFRPSDSGELEHHFTVVLTDGRIVTLEHSWASDAPSEYEDVGIASNAIAWTHEPSGVTQESRQR